MPDLKRLTGVTRNIHRDPGDSPVRETPIKTGKTATGIIGVKSAAVNFATPNNFFV